MTKTTGALEKTPIADVPRRKWPHFEDRRERAIVDYPWYVDAETIGINSSKASADTKERAPDEFGRPVAANTTKEKKTDSKETEARLANGMVGMIMESPQLVSQIASLAATPQKLGFLVSQVMLGARDKMIKDNLLTDDNIWAEPEGVLETTMAQFSEVLEHHTGRPMDEETYAATLESALDKLQMFDEAGAQSRAKPQAALSSALGE